MKKYINSPWGISIGTTIFGVLLTLLIDLIKSKPVLSTLLNLGNFLRNGFLSIMSFEIKIWAILVALIIFLIISKTFSQIKLSHNGKPVFYEYRSDVFKVWKWTWNWEQNSYNSRWGVTDLKALCPKCGHSLLKTNNIIHGYCFDCPMCNFYSEDESVEHPTKIEQLIYDRASKIN